MNNLKTEIINAVVASLLNSESIVKDSQPNNIYSHYIGLYVIVCSYRSGVYFGKIKNIEHAVVVLDESRKISYWAGELSMTDIAIWGILNKKDTYVAAPLNDHLVGGVYEVIPCLKASIEFFKSFPIGGKIDENN